MALVLASFCFRRQNRGLFTLLPMLRFQGDCRLKGTTGAGTTVEPPYKKLTEISEWSVNQPLTGKIYDKKPFKFSLEKGKKYRWCCCGWSKSQPFCDGTHANPHMRIKIVPVVFIPAESGDYWLCNCKQTAHRPFCDGTHRGEEIQAKIKS